MQLNVCVALRMPRSNAARTSSSQASLCPPLTLTPCVRKLSIASSAPGSSGAIVTRLITSAYSSNCRTPAGDGS
ncbi:MAG: hypothetical protein WA496_00180, partial [Candidatus Udaeobacter sp.]